MVKEGKSGVVEWKTRPVGRPRHLTEVQHLVCIEAYTTKSATVRELAEVYGISRTGMQGYLRGFFRPRRTRDDERVLRERASGKTVRSIAQELHMSPNTVMSVLKEHGLCKK